MIVHFLKDHCFQSPKTIVDIKFEDAISGSTRLKSMKNFLNKTKHCLRETTARCGALNYFAAGSLEISIRPQSRMRRTYFDSHFDTDLTHVTRKRQVILCSRKKKNLKQVCQNVRFFFIVWNNRKNKRMICRIYVRAVLPIGCFYLIMTSKEKFCAFSLWSRFWSKSHVQRASEKSTSILLSKEQHFLLSSFLTRGSCFNHLVFKRRYAKYRSDLEPS